MILVSDVDLDLLNELHTYGSVRNLKAGMLVIADENKPIGLAGIMGGENSEIKDDTAMVVFESANFDGTSIRQTALALGMRTDASTRYEKGLDPENTMPALARALELRLRNAGGVEHADVFRRYLAA